MAYNKELAKELKKKMKDAKKELYNAAMAYANEEAKREDVTEITVDMISSQSGADPNDFNGWQCDWWSDDHKILAGKKFNISGGAFYGSVTFSLPEDDE